MLSAQGTSDVLFWYGSMLCAMAMWGYTLWLTIAFFRRRQGVPRHYIIWLLLTVLLAIKSFAFSPVSDALTPDGFRHLTEIVQTTAGHQFRAAVIRGTIVSCCSRCWPPRCWYPISSARRA